MTWWCEVYLEMMDDGGGKVLVLANKQRHCPLPEGEGDERALLQRAAVLQVGEQKYKALCWMKFKVM